MLEIVPATHAHVDAVLARAWQAGRDEMAAAGVGLDEWREQMHARVGSRFSFAVLLEGAPVACMGGLPVGEARFGAWFAATDDFARIGARGTLAIRRFLAERMAENPGAALDMHTLSADPRAETWFKLLGFRCEERRGLYRRYAYVA